MRGSSHCDLDAWLSEWNRRPGEFFWTIQARPRELCVGHTSGFEEGYAEQVIMEAASGELTLAGSVFMIVECVEP